MSGDIERRVPAWEGSVSDARYYPFAMKSWETRLFHHYALPAIETGRINLPRWFKVWLWLRTKWARFVHYIA